METFLSLKSTILVALSLSWKELKVSKKIDLKRGYVHSAFPAFMKKKGCILTTLRPYDRRDWGKACRFWSLRDELKTNSFRYRAEIESPLQHRELRRRIKTAKKVVENKLLWRTLFRIWFMCTNITASHVLSFSHFHCIGSTTSSAKSCEAT